jgi:hypothetical protein
VSPSDHDSESKPLVTLELWQLVVIVLGVVVFAVKFLPIGKNVLLVLLLLAALVGLLVARARKRREADF